MEKVNEVNIENFIYITIYNLDGLRETDCINSYMEEY